MSINCTGQNEQGNIMFFIVIKDPTNFLLVIQNAEEAMRFLTKRMHMKGC